VVVALASPRESPDPDITRPLVAPERNQTLLLKVFQFAAERAPVVVALASPRESPVPDITRPLVAPERNPILFEKSVKSVDLRSPLAEADAYGRLNV
jgi:hypothetical protein